MWFAIRLGVALERAEGGAQCVVAFVSGPVEPVVGGELLRRIPDTFDRVQLWRIRWQPEQLDATSVSSEPALPIFVKVVAGPVCR